MTADDGPKEACKTYVEQTKLLVTLASAFVAAPVAVVPWLASHDQVHILLDPSAHSFLWAEIGFVFSVFMGYVVLATIAGWQQQNKFDVNRPATRWCSLVQIGSYLAGLVCFVRFLRAIL